MSTILRGVKNTFRNPTRTLSVAVVFGVVVGLALAMLIAQEAVDDRISKVKESIGNTITISPAGARGFMGGGEPLKESNLAGIAELQHVVKLTAVLQESLQQDNTTSLKSAIEPGTLGGRGKGPRIAIEVKGGQEGEIKLPIPVSGVDNAAEAKTMDGSTPTLTAGNWFDGASENREAVVGKDLAAKNNLAVGSTFAAHNETITVTGIFDAGNMFANNALFMPIKTLQKLAKLEGEISTATVTVDSYDNAEAAEKSIKEKLGTKADVVSQKKSADEAVKPLVSIRRVTALSLLGTLIVGAVIIFLVMTMTVRERRKEVAVLKVLGASDMSVVTQFLSESLSMALVGSVIGIAAGVAMGNPILSMLAQQGSEPADTGFPGPGKAGGPVLIRIGQAAIPQAKEVLENLQGTVDLQIVLYGLGAAILIAVVGSLIPVATAAQVRPAEVLRGE